MTAADKPRPAFSAEQPLRAPEVSSARVPGTTAAGPPSEQETMLLCGIRLMQRVSAGGTLTAFEWAALQGTSQMLAQLAEHCAAVVKSLGADSAAAKAPAPSPRRATGKRRAAKKKTDGGLQ